MVLIVSLFLIIRRPLRSTSSYTHFPQTPLFRSGRALHHYPPGGRIMSEQAVHANCVALDGRAVLLMGASGSGKSDLALRLIHRGWSLVSDDYVTLECRGRKLLAPPPAHIASRLDVRHVGLLRLPFITGVPVSLAIFLLCAPARSPTARVWNPT